MPVLFGTVTRRPVRRGPRRALTLALLTVLTVPLLAGAASAVSPDVGKIGTRYDPDPLSALESWLIYGGTIVAGFLLALALTALANRGSSARYRPGQPWEHPEIWVGKEPEAAKAAEGGDGARAGAQGSGGASGSW
ncbi:MAG: hypothetical protein IRZ08_10715 [Frankia sp.]|nr:hypothetical protein [Frankia sp.]